MGADGGTTRGEQKGGCFICRMVEALEQAGNRSSLERMRISVECAMQADMRHMFFESALRLLQQRQKERVTGSLQCMNKTPLHQRGYTGSMLP